MGLRSIQGQDLNALTTSAARAPASRSRPAEPARDTAPVARASPEPDEQYVRRTVSMPRDNLGLRQTETRLRIDEASKRIVAQIVNEDHEVIKQIPSEELLRIAARFRDLQGKLFDRKA